MYEETMNKQYYECYNHEARGFHKIEACSIEEVLQKIPDHMKLNEVRIRDEEGNLSIYEFTAQWSHKEKLLPCPFCGSHHVEVRSVAVDAGVGHEVYCKECGTKHPAFMDERDAKAMWNKRNTQFYR